MIGLADKVGSLEVGKQADILIVTEEESGNIRLDRVLKNGVAVR
jgi:imidazolonepropionase-like amidohydrolase